MNNLNPRQERVLEIILRYALANSDDIAEAIGEPFTDADVRHLSDNLGVEL